VFWFCFFVFLVFFFFFFQPSFVHRHSTTLQQLEESSSALEGFSALLDQAQGQIETLIAEQGSLRAENSKLAQDLAAVQNKLAAERSHGENGGVQQGLHSDTYRSLLEQKQHQKIEMLLEAQRELETRANEAEQLSNGFSEQTTQLLQELESSKKDNNVLEEKNKSFLKLVASLKQQVKDAQAAGPGALPVAALQVDNKEVEVLKVRLVDAVKEKEAQAEQSRDQIASFESEIRQRDAISGMQQRVLEDTHKKVRELSATVEQLLQQVQSHQDGAQEFQQQVRLQSEEKAVLAEECQRLRDRVERAERELTRSKSDLRSRAASSGVSTEEAQRTREKLETQLRTARDEASTAVSEQFVLNQRNEELTQSNAQLRGRIEELQAENARVQARVEPSLLMEKERLVTDLNGQLASVQRELAAVTSAAAKGRAAEALQARVKDLEELVNAGGVLKTELAEKEQEISRLKGESEGRIAALAVADKMIKTLEAKRDSLAVDLRSSSNRVQELEISARESTSQRSVLQSLVKKLQEEVTSLKSSGDSEVHLQKLLGEARSDLSRVVAERNSLQHRLQDGEAERAAGLITLRDEFARVSEEQNSLREKLDHERSINVEMRAEMARIVQERNSLHERLESSNGELLKLASVVESDAAKERQLTQRYASDVESLEKRLDEEHKARDRAEQGFQAERARLQRELDSVVRRLGEERADLVAQVDTIKRAFEAHKIEAQELKVSHEKRKQKAAAFRIQTLASLQRSEQANQALIAEREELVRQVDLIKRTFEQQQEEGRASQAATASVIESLRAELAATQGQAGEVGELRQLLSEARDTILRVQSERDGVRQRQEDERSRALAQVEEERALRKRADDGFEAERSRLQRDLDTVTRRLGEERGDFLAQLEDERRARDRAEQGFQVEKARLQRELDSVVRRLGEERADLVGQVDTIKRAFEAHKIEAQELKRSHGRRKQKVAEFRADAVSRLQKADQENQALIAEREELVKQVDRIRRTFEQQQHDAKTSQETTTAIIQSLRAELAASQKQAVEGNGFRQLLNEARETILRVQSERDGVRQRLEEEAANRTRAASELGEEKVLRNRAQEGFEAEKARLQRELDSVVRRLGEERADLVAQVDTIKRAFEAHKVEAQELKRSHERRKQKVTAFGADTLSRVEEERNVHKQALLVKDRLLETSDAERSRLARELDNRLAERNELGAKVAAIQRAFDQHRTEEAQKSRALAELKTERERLALELESLRRSLESAQAEAGRLTTGNTTELALLKKLLSDARLDITRLHSERELTRGRLEEALEAHDKSVDAWKEQRVELLGQVGTLQEEVSRLVQERQRLRVPTHDPEEAAELRRQRDALREAVKKLQQPHQYDSASVGQIAQLQALLTAEKNLNESLRRRMQRERLGSRLEALDTVGKQIQDLKHVLSGEWSSISIANASLAPDSSVRKPHRNSGFVSPATPVSRNGATATSRLTDALEAERKRRDRSEQNLN
jgi:chromosome segregation ATPase